MHIDLHMYTHKFTFTYCLACTSYFAHTRGMPARGCPEATHEASRGEAGASSLPGSGSRPPREGPGSGEKARRLDCQGSQKMANPVNHGRFAPQKWATSLCFFWFLQGGKPLVAYTGRWTELFRPSSRGRQVVHGTTRGFGRSQLQTWLFTFLRPVGGGRISLLALPWDTAKGFTSYFGEGVAESQETAEATVRQSGAGDGAEASLELVDSTNWFHPNVDQAQQVKISPHALVYAWSKGAW